MEQTTPEELTQQPLQEEPELLIQERPLPNPRRRERKPQKKAALPDLSRLKLPAFLKEIGRDVKWYYDVRLWVPVILVLLILSMCSGSSMGKNSADREYTAALEALTSEFQQEKEALTQALAEAQTPPEIPAAPIDPEAEALAILADSVGGGRSDNVKRAIMWVAINRSEDTRNGYGKSLLEEIARPDQWMWYDPEIKYSQTTYDIALEVLKIRDTGALRPLDSDMLWFVHNDNGSITVRNMFTATGNQKWVEKVVK